MMTKQFVKTLFALLVLVQPVHAALISNTDITASTDLIHRTDFPGSDWSVDKIADGVTADLPSPYAGFVSQSTSGTVRLDFNGGPYDLTNFRLYNDVFVGAQGIGSFRLDFFDSSDSFIDDFSATALGGVLAPQDFAISALNVSRVDLVVLTSYFQIEIREVEFNGEASSVPEPSILALLGLGLTGIGFARRRRRA